MAVLALHTAVLEDVLRTGTHNSPPAAVEISITEAGFFESTERLDKVPAPDLQLTAVPVDFPALRQVEFDDSVQDELGAVIGAVSAPHLARVQSVDLDTFARRAKLPPGVALTTILRVEVTVDGSVDSVDLARTSGNAAADAAAIDYALEVRWVPGTVDRSPVTQRVAFPVTMGPTVASPLPSRCDSHVHLWGARTCARSTSQ